MLHPGGALYLGAAGELIGADGLLQRPLRSPLRRGLLTRSSAHPLLRRFPIVAELGHAELGPYLRDLVRDGDSGPR